MFLDRLFHFQYNRIDITWKFVTIEHIESIDWLSDDHSSRPFLRYLFHLQCILLSIYLSIDKIKCSINTLSVDKRFDILIWKWYKRINRKNRGKCRYFSNTNSNILQILIIFYILSLYRNPGKLEKNHKPTKNQTQTKKKRNNSEKTKNFRKN